MTKQPSSETREVTSDDIEDLRKEIQKLDRKLAGVLVAPTLQKHRLLAGLTQPEQYAEIEARLKENVTDKQNLSAYLTKHLVSELTEEGNRNPRIFVESGSTLAYFAASLAQAIEKKTLPELFELLTNNFLALTAFGVGHVAVTPGSLESDYLAFLPFRNAHRKRRLKTDTDSDIALAPISEQDRASDIDAFRNLDRAIGSVDHIYMTASQFGFLVGPHVGSRANAIFKYCLLNNRAHRNIRLCIAQSKVHCLGGPAEDVSPEEVEDKLRNECYTTFNLGQELKVDKDPDILTDFLVMTRSERDSVPGPGSEEHEDQLRSAPTEMGLPMNTDGSELCEGYGLTGLQGTWRSFLKSCTPGCLEIIIGLRSDSEPLKRKAALRDAMKAANGILTGNWPNKGWGLDRVYLEKKDSKEDARAFHIIIDRPETL